MIFIALGSSVGDAENTFNSAQLWLEQHGLQVIKKSTNLNNPPCGGVAQNDFTNAVWQIEFLETKWEQINWCLLPQRRRWHLKAKKLLNLLQQCENAHGRVRTKRWDDRTLDLDILQFHQLQYCSKKLKIPHPEIPKRVFVLQPWSEIVDEDFCIPKFGRLTELLTHLN